jgi:ribosome-binding factor A
MNIRSRRVGDEMRRIISQIVLRELSDPRLPDMLSITGVEVSKDLGHAKVYYSVLGDEDKRNDAKVVLANAKGFIRREVGMRMKLRVVPEIVFKADRSIEQGFAMDRLIDSVLAEDKKAKSDGDD